MNQVPLADPAISKPLFSVNMTEAQLQRFWSKISRGGPDDCWRWNAAQQRKGYGHLRLGGKDHKPHRISYFLANGPFDNSLQILHSCDNPLCCNPAHLSTGSNDDNVKDCVSKKRHAFGPRNGHCKLSTETIAEIRRKWHSGRTQRSIAREYGIDQGYVSVVVRGLARKLA